MALTQSAVVQTAVDILRSFGLADLSMRRLAKELDVQVGALYWHVKNKQELLVEVAVQILNSPELVVDPHDFASARAAILQLARKLYLALLPIQDSPEVIEVAQAMHPEQLRPLAQFSQLFAQLGLDEQESVFARQLLLNHILGSVALRQNLSSLDVPHVGPDGFDWGLEHLLAGLSLAAESN